MPEPDGLPTPRYVLSRFAYLRHDGQSLVLESSLTPARLPASEGLLALLHRLSRPVSLAALLDALPPASREATRNAFDLLVEHGFLSPADGTEADRAEDSSSPPEQARKRVQAPTTSVAATRCLKVESVVAMGVRALPKGILVSRQPLVDPEYLETDYIRVRLTETSRYGIPGGATRRIVACSNA